MFQRSSYKAQAISRRLGIQPKHIAYPGGEWSSETEALVVRHYETAWYWGCDDVPYQPNTFVTNPYRLQTINVSMQMSEAVFH
ncbi:MAG: hypothetical protein MK110_06570 [Fuerstiella sp.]|nr:hypothetical protein [Fuerstiella sp.]